MSIPAKVMGRVIVDRMKKGVDAQLRREQAGFRSGRSTLEHIFTLRNIIEQTVEWNSNLYVCYVDFEKAFDSIHRETLWKIMTSYGVPAKIVKMVRAMYEDCSCTVASSSGGAPSWFKVRSGVRQGCVMSGFLFLLIIDWTMQRVLEGENTGIRWTLMEQLEDLDFADDIALIASSIGQLEKKLERVNQRGSTTGLKINTKKTKVMRYNAKSKEPLRLQGQEIEEVESFVYLGATMTVTGGTADDIRSRLGKAWGAFNKLRK